MTEADGSLAAALRRFFRLARLPRELRRQLTDNARIGDCLECRRQLARLRLIGCGGNVIRSLVALLLAVLVFAPAPGAAQTACTFALGFKTLHDLIPLKRPGEYLRAILSA